MRIYRITRYGSVVKVYAFGNGRSIRKDIYENTAAEAVISAYKWAEKTAKKYAKRTGGTAVYTTVPEQYYKPGIDKTCWLVR